MQSTAVAGTAGAMGLALSGHGAWAVAFALGAAISLGNFWLIAQAVGRLGGDGAMPSMWKGSLFRFALIGAALVVALLVFRVNLIALVAGLLLAQVWMVGHWLLRTLIAQK